MSEKIDAYTIEDEYDDESNEPSIKIYRSKFPGNLPPSWSTFNNKTTAHPGVNNINGDFKLHTGYYRHYGRHAHWGRPKNVKGLARDEDNPMLLAVGFEEQPICENKKPQIFKHYAYKANQEELQKYKEKKELEKKRPQSAKKLEYKNFGQVPKYLQKMKDEKLEQEKQKHNQSNLKKTQGNVTKDELKKIQQGLIQKHNELHRQYAQYAHKASMIEKQRKLKEQLEKQIAEVEKDLEKINILLRKKQ